MRSPRAVLHILVRCHGTYRQKDSHRTGGLFSPDPLRMTRKIDEEEAPSQLRGKKPKNQAKTLGGFCVVVSCDRLVLSNSLCASTGSSQRAMSPCIRILGLTALSLSVSFHKTVWIGLGYGRAQDCAKKPNERRGSVDPRALH